MDTRCGYCYSVRSCSHSHADHTEPHSPECEAAHMDYLAGLGRKD